MQPITKQLLATTFKHTIGIKDMPLKRYKKLLNLALNIAGK